MKNLMKPLLGIIAVLLAASATMAHAQVRITEVAAWGSGNSPVAADWFELTNTGASAVNISGWKFDDSSAAFGSAALLSGITNIGAGESVIFLESSTNISASFLNNWFGGNPPAGLQIGNYSGSGLGLSTSGDGVSVFNAGGTLQAKVTFNASSGSPYRTFDNAAGLNNTAISQMSVIGTNGAFVAANDAFEIGSPGMIAAVPEPQTYAMLLAGLGLVGAIARRRKSVNLAKESSTS